MLDIQNKLHYILSPSASNICNDYDRVKIFALIDQDINSDVVLKNEEDEWNKFDYYRWKRRCIESYLFDNIKVLDLLADSSDECLPSGILTDIKYLYTWYEELLEVVQKRISDSNEKDQKRNSGYEKEAIDVTNALKIHNLPDIRKFGPYQKVVKNALKSYDRNVNLNAASKRRYSDWLKKKGIVWKSNNPCHQYISNALKAAQDREFEQRNAEPAVKEWFTSRNIVDPSTEEMDTQKAQSELLHWVNAHAVVKTLKKFSSVNLKDLTTLENLFKKRANIDPLDQGIIEMRQMLDHFFGWLSD